MGTGGLGYWIGAWWGTPVWEVWTRSAISWRPGSWVEVPRKADARPEAVEARYRACLQRLAARTARLLNGTEVAP